MGKIREVNWKNKKFVEILAVHVLCEDLNLLKPLID